jgi:spermidine synthase
VSAPRLPARASASPLLFSGLLGAFFASGVAALLYQVIWQRMLALFSGADVFSVTIVVSAFMAGLGCGNFAGGHLADRLSRVRCLWLFAAAELAIALFAIVSKTLYYDVLYVQHADWARSSAVLACVLFSAVLWPTFFMGLSLPLLTRAVTPALDLAARTVGGLYGWNTLGAAAGALVTTWLLLRRFDLPTCLRIGAALNLSCAAIALPIGLALRRVAPAAAPPAPAHEPPAAPLGEAPAPARRLLGLRGWLLIYTLSGAIALSLEIAWFRVLGVMLKSTSFTFGTLLAVYLAGVASGSIVGARATGEPPAAARRFLLLQAWVPIYAAASLALFSSLVGELAVSAPLFRYFALGEPLQIAKALESLAREPLGFLTSSAPLAPYGRMFATLHGLLPVLLIGPPTFLMGMSFPYLQRAVQTDLSVLGRRVGWLQTANIAGSLFGSVITGFVLLPSLGTAGVFRLLAVGGGVFLLLALGVSRRAGLASPWALAAAGLALAAGAAAFPANEVFWSRLHGAPRDALSVAEDAAAVSALRPSADGRASHVMAGGLELSSMPYGGYFGIHSLLGALPVLVHPDPRRVAVIGLGSGDTSFAAGGRPGLEEVVTIEIIGSQLDLLRRFDARIGYGGLRGLLTDPRMRLVVGDGRTWLRRDPVAYDVIEADALRPTSAYAGNLYSVEYFELVRERLREGGLGVTWVPTRRVHDSFVRVFPYVVLVEVEHTQIALGSESPIPFDAAVLRARVEDPEIRSYYQRAGIDLRRLVGEAMGRATSVGPELDRSPLVDVNSDLFAKDEFLVESPAR